MNNYLVLDFETTIADLYHRSPNPFFQSVLCVGLIYNINNTRTVRAVTWDDSESGIDLSNIQLLIGHNIKYDLLCIWKYGWLQKWLSNGGVIYDTQLAEYIITGQENKFASLRTLAVEKYGCKERVKHIEELLEQGVAMENMSMELLLDDVMNDVKDTEQIYLQQQKIIKQQQQEHLIRTQMDFLLATTEMEYNGMHVNREILINNKTNLEIELNKNINEALSIINQYWPQHVEFNINSGYHISILLFGGQLMVKQLKEVGLCKNGNVKKRIVEEPVTIKGLKLKPLVEWKLNKTGFYSTDESVLSALHQAIRADGSHLSKIDVNATRLLKYLLKIRELKKQLSTYYEAILERIYTTDNCVHGMLHHTATDTGRLSGSNPNLQNQPRANESFVKQHFVSRYNDGLIIEVDKSQLEVVAAAYLSQDSNLIKVLNEGKDIHRYTGSALYKKPENEVTKDERQRIKPCTFLILYGGGAQKLSITTGNDLEFCKEFIETFYNLFPGIRDWHNQIIEEVGYTSKLTLPTGRIIKFKRYPAKYDWQIKKGIKESYNPSEIKDRPVQALATADVVPLVVGKLFKKALDHRDKFLLINTVHDSLVMDCKKEFKEDCLELINLIFSQTCAIIEQEFKIKINVPIKYEIKYGTSWYDAGL